MTDKKMTFEISATEGDQRSYDKVLLPLRMVLGGYFGPAGMLGIRTENAYECNVSHVANMLRSNSLQLQHLDVVEADSPFDWWRHD